jgi:hypothetical protein
VTSCEKVSVALRPLRVRVRSPYNGATMFCCKKSLCVIPLLLIAIVIGVGTQKMQPIAAGVWGGQHINLEAGEKSATIEYDCANGVIDGPLVVDGNGKFSWRGTHRMERGGPIRADEKPKEYPATYTGSVSGNTMTLTLKVSDLDEETFTLEKGKPGDLFKCK